MSLIPPPRSGPKGPAKDWHISGRGGDRLDRDHVRAVTLQHRARDLDLLFDEGEQARVLRIGRLRARQHVDLAVVAEDRERHPGLGAGRGARLVARARRARRGEATEIDDLARHRHVLPHVHPAHLLGGERQATERQHRGRDDESLQHRSSPLSRCANRSRDGRAVALSYKTSRPAVPDAWRSDSEGLARRRPGARSRRRDGTSPWVYSHNLQAMNGTLWNFWSRLQGAPTAAV